MAAQQQSDRIYCFNCGHINPPGSAQCEQCDRLLRRDSTRPWWLTVFILFTIFVQVFQLFTGLGTLDLLTYTLSIALIISSVGVYMMHNRGRLAFIVAWGLTRALIALQFLLYSNAGSSIAVSISAGYALDGLIGLLVIFWMLRNETRFKH
jgi:hypothetical protein